MELLIKLIDKVSEVHNQTAKTSAQTAKNCQYFGQNARVSGTQSHSLSLHSERD